MVERKRRKKNKLRGNRSHGWGNVKNRRSGGSTGGRGRAGSWKHKKLMYRDEVKEPKLKMKKRGTAVNLSWIEEKLDNLLKQKLVTKDEDYFVIDGKALGITKVLSSGKVNHKYLVKNIKLSEKARTKITEADGEIEE